MNSERQQLLGDVPPPRRRFPARRLRFSPTLVAGGIVFGIILLVVVMNISSNPGDKNKESELTTGITELITPDQLEETDLTEGSALDARTSSVVDLPQGGWIQTTKENGEPAQQYRFSKLDPTPDGYGAGWLLMQQPQADFFLSENRIVSMTGDSALAFAPGRTLTEGTLTGNVVIRMFESIDGQTPDPRRAPPTLEIRTQEATFDNFTGEIICTGTVDIQSAAVHIPGQGLRLRMNDRAGRIESLTMQSVETIRLIAPEKTTAVANRQSPAIPRVILARHRQGGPSVPSTSSSDPQFYVLTLHKDIRIVQGDDRSGRTATGDAMFIVFSLEGSTARSSLSERNPADTKSPMRLTSTPAPRPLLHSLATLAVASFDDDAGLFHPTADDLITTINCSGGLDMVPAANDENRLDSPDDLRLTLTGAPVVLNDAGEDFRGECGEAVFHGLEESVHLIASAAHSVMIASPQLEGGGEHFFYSKAMHRAGFRNAGWLNAGSQSSDGPAKHEDPLEKLHITWTEGVDFAFSEPPTSGNPESPSSTAKPILNSAEFRGEVKVASDRGTINGELIHLELSADKVGKSVPKSMVVQGKVKASDPDITLWADDLDIAFIVADPDVTPSPDEGDDTSIFGGDMDIDTLTASGDVQTLLSDGSRAFADHIHGEASTQTIEFTGDNVVFVSDRLLLDRGKHYTLRKKDGVFHGEGPGQARIFSEAIQVDDDRRIPRPWTEHPAPNPEVQARWNRSMEYDHTFNEEAGKIDLEGKVQAVSQPSPRQLDSLKGETVSLEFALEKENSLKRGDAPPPSTITAPTFKEDQKRRQLSQMVATGEAVMESRSWLMDDHSDSPRIFSIAAPHIEFDNLSEEALAKGKGEMLIRTPRPPNSSVEDSGGTTAPFSSQGTSLFRWTDKLKMTPALGDTSVITIRGDVRAIHKSSDRETAIITGDRLDATIALDTPSESEESSVKITKPRRGDHLSFGGPRQIRKLFGQGAIFIRTPTREVLCDRFEYNLITEIAEMRAKGSGRVTIKTIGSSDLTQAGLVYWDMARDSITIERATGG